MTTKKELLEEYVGLEDAIEDAAPVAPTWDLGDWLVDNVPNPGRGKSVSGAVSLEDLAAKGRRGARELQKLRKTAEATRPNRLAGVSARAYGAALTAAQWDLSAANARLKRRGTKLRDQSGSMMSPQALATELAKAPMEKIERVIAALPEKRQQAIAAAAGDEYAGMRERFDQKQPQTAAGRKARDAQVDSFVKDQARVARSFAAMGIAVHIEQAIDDLREAIEAEAVTVELLAEIEKQADLLATEIEVARGMVGLQARR